MPLSLKVPALSDKPLIIAETRTHKVADFISRLPLSNPLETATALFEELEILNRQKVSSDDRLRALELYRPIIIDLCQQLAHEYDLAPLPLPDKAKSYAGAAESLWLELSYGYKLALLDKQKKLFSLDREKSTALVVQRAMEAMRELALVYHQTYFSLPDSVWADLNQLYLYAVQQSLQDIKVASDAEHSSSISQTYKQALLMALADPQRMASIDIKRTADYINRHSALASLNGLGLIENPAGVFLLRLDSDKPPVPYAKSKGDTEAKHYLFLVTIELARLVHKHIHQIKSDRYADSTELPDDAGDPRYLDLLTYLIKQWSESPKRIFDRSRNNNSVEIAIGIQAAHHLFFEEKGQQTNKTVVSGEQIDEAPLAEDHTSVISSKWLLLNLSAGGVALRKPPNIKDHLRVGSLICMRESEGKHWSVGVVRWAANNDEQQIDIGTQLIAPTARPARIRKVDREDFEKTLILPGITVLKQSISLIAPNGFYSPAGQLELEENGKVSRIIITKLIDRTNSFEHFNFSYL